MGVRLWTFGGDRESGLVLSVSGKFLIRERVIQDRYGAGKELFSTANSWIESTDK